VLTYTASARNRASVAVITSSINSTQRPCRAGRRARNWAPRPVGCKASSSRWTPRSPKELAALAREFKIFYRQTPGPIENSYTLDHTAASYMYDPQGRLRLYQTYGIGADAMAANALALLHEKSAD